jgi:hypothetical protein
MPNEKLIEPNIFGICAFVLKYPTMEDKWQSDSKWNSCVIVFAEIHRKINLFL